MCSICAYSNRFTVAKRVTDTACVSCPYQVWHVDQYDRHEICKRPKFPRPFTRPQCIARSKKEITPIPTTSRRQHHAWRRWIRHLPHPDRAWGLRYGLRDVEARGRPDPELRVDRHVSIVCSILACDVFVSISPVCELTLDFF